MTRVTGNQVHRLLGTMKSANWYWLFLPQNMKWFGGGADTLGLVGMHNMCETLRSLWYMDDRGYVVGKALYD